MTADGLQAMRRQRISLTLVLRKWRWAWFARVVALPMAVAVASCTQSAQAEFDISTQASAGGWNPQQLEQAYLYARALGSDTLLIITDDKVVGRLGSLDEPFNLHSIRKALLSALVGQHVGPGPAQIDLEATLQDLGIGDEPKPLLPVQRQAKVLHLIRSVSGINRDAAAEGGMFDEKKRRLGDQPNPPGSVWAYNNWDYNALTTIFEQRTGLPVADAFATGIAQPLGMQDFSRSHVRYSRSRAKSRHAAAMFRMSGRDLARVGRLYLAHGRWGERQIVPADWVDRITGDYSSTGDGGLNAGHGYLWWLPDPDVGFPPGTYWASGFGRQALFVVPAWNTVIVHQADTRALLRRAGGISKESGVSLLQAVIELSRECIMEQVQSDFCRDDGFILKRNFRRLIDQIVDARIR